MESRLEFYKSAFAPQAGGGFEFPVFQGRMQYGYGYNVFHGRQQYGAGLGDVLRGMWRFFRPVAMKGAQTLLKAGGEAIKDGATVRDVLSSTLKPTVGALLGATAEQVASRLTAEKPAAAPPSGPPDTYTLPQQTGSGKRKRHRVYKTKNMLTKKYKNLKGQRPIIYNF